MAYNREWDHGKDQWADNSQYTQWSDNSQWPRDDTTNKRRKFTVRLLGCCKYLIDLAAGLRRIRRRWRRRASTQETARAL